MLKEALKLLKVFDGNKPTMGKACLTMKNLEKHMLNLRNHLFNLVHDLTTLAKENCYSSWRMMTTNLHHAGAMLNLYLLDDLSIYEDVVIKSIFLGTMKRLTTCINNQYDWVVAKFQTFKEHSSVFANILLAMEVDIPPHK